MAITPRLARFTSKSEESGYVNNLSINGFEGSLSLSEIPTSFVDFSFDPSAKVGFLFADGIGDLLSARVQLWSDLNNDGAINGGDLPSVPDIRLTDLTWEQVLAASGNGSNDIILAIDDDGASSDGDFNDLIIAGDIAPPPEDPKPEDCVVSNVVFETIFQDSDFNNVLIVKGSGESGAEVTEELEVTYPVTFDATDALLGNFVVDNEGNAENARVQIYVSDGDRDYEPGVAGPEGDGEAIAEIPVSALTWTQLAAWSENGTRDLILAIDDDGADIDEDFNDIVIHADFQEPVCEPVEPCVISEGSFYTVSQDSGYFNTLLAQGDGFGVSVKEDGSSGWVWVAFDGESEATGNFSLESLNGGDVVDSSLARVKVYVDVDDNGILDENDGDPVLEKALGELTWSDVVGATSDAMNSIFLAIDDDGANIDEDYNDIVVKFAAVPCETDCGCECTYTSSEFSIA